MAYGHASGKDLPELFDSIREHQEQGYKADPRADRGARAQGDLRHRRPTPTRRREVRYDHEPAQRGACPTEEDWDTRAYLRHLPSVFEAVRNEFGPELPLLHDGHHRMTPDPGRAAGQGPGAVRPVLARGLHAGREPGGAAPGPPAHHDAAGDRRDLQHRLGLPGPHPGTADRLRAGAVTHFGGITHLKKVLDYAAQYQIKSGMHGPTDISPVGLAAAMHLGLAIHNFGIQEYMQHGDKTNQVFEQSFTWTDGYLHPGDKPGLGVDARRRRGGQVPVRAGLPAVARRRGRDARRAGRGSRPVVACSALNGRTVPRLAAVSTRGAVFVHLTPRPRFCAAATAAGTDIRPPGCSLAAATPRAARDRRARESRSTSMPPVAEIVRDCTRTDGRAGR